MSGLMLLAPCILMTGLAFLYCKLGAIQSRRWKVIFMGYCVFSMLVSYWVLAVRAEKLINDSYFEIAVRKGLFADTSRSREAVVRRLKQFTYSVYPDARDSDLDEYEDEALPMAVVTELLLVGIPIGWLQLRLSRGLS